MDIRQYIESGILEQYVLGMLDENQQAEVRRMAEQHPEVREEISSIEAALETYVQAYAKEPPASVREKVLEEIGPSSGGSSNFLKFLLLAASWVILLGLIWYVYSEKRQVEEQNERITTQLDTVQSRLQQLTSDCQEISRRYAALIAPGNKSINLGGTPLSPDSYATVFYNPDDNSTFLTRVNLPQAPTGSQYQLWAIVDGQPVDMGVIPIDSSVDTFINVPFVENAKAFAVTLEIEGGSPTPTLDQMYVIGQI